MELKILFLFTYLYFFAINPSTFYFQTFGEAFENGSELFDHLLGYHITFQKNRIRLLMNL